MAACFSRHETASMVPKRIPWLAGRIEFGRSFELRRFSGVVGGVVLFLGLVSLGICASAVFGCASGGRDSKVPQVVSTFPLGGSVDVDPGITEISVTFDTEMTDRSWSWAYEDKKLFPEVVGEPRFTDGNTRNVLPVRLEPNKVYQIWINTAKYSNFKDKSGNPAVPFRFMFTTGKPR